MIPAYSETTGVEESPPIFKKTVCRFIQRVPIAEVEVITGAWDIQHPSCNGIRRLVDCGGDIYGV